MPQSFVTADVLRLEIEAEPTGIYNMIANPDGELGGWGWITPIAGSNLTGGPVTGVNTLTYTSPTPSATSYFTPEVMPITAGEYAAAAWTLVSVTGYYRVRFEWMNSSQVGISFSPMSGFLNTAGAAAYGAQLAPAGTAYMRLWFYHYSNTSSGNPTAGATMQLRSVKVAKAATSGALGSSRTNLITNPSFENNSTTGWVNPSPGNTSVDSQTGQASVGTYSLRLRNFRGFAANAYTYTSVSVAAGRDYVFQFRSRADVTVRAPYSTVEWYDGAGVKIGNANGKNHATNSLSAWTSYSHLATAPSGAVTARVSLLVYAPNGDGAWFDAVMFTEGSDTPAYFDGTTAGSGTVTYAWTGTPHASASVMNDSTLGSLAVAQWRNVLGSSHEIQVERESLNLGTLSATVIDAALDPSQASELRPGRRVRLTALSSGLWEPIFTGKATRIDVEYDEKAVPPKPPRISMTAVDNTQALAATKRPEGVGTIAALPFVLEGAGVPWKVNGSGNQVSSATVVSTNDNATALDQIALTRDSVLGFAWVDRRGVLVANDYVASPSPITTLNEAIYSDLGLSFSSEDCINSVTVKLLGPDAADATKTVETTYGPYEDAVSIGEWGRRSADFTVHGISAGGVAAYAASILARNSNPGVRVNTLSLPIRVAGDVTTTKALLDLGDVVAVVNTAKSVSQNLRINEVSHRITPDKWMVDLGFAHPASVASPQPAPPISNGSGPGEAGIVQMFAGATPPAGWLLCDGSSKAVASYPALHAAIGYTYGGSGANFNLPRMQGRSPVGVGAADTGSTGNSYSLGQKYGHESMQQHDHGGATTTESNFHTHGEGAAGFAGVYSASGETYGVHVPTSATTGPNDQLHTHIVNVDGAGNAGNVHPVLGLNFIIKVA